MPRRTRWHPQPRSFLSLAAIVSFLFPLTASRAFGAWPSDGLPIAAVSGRQDLPRGISAPNGDVLVFWSEFAGSPYVLFAQRITVQGTVASGWQGSGRGVVEAPAFFSAPDVEHDGFGGYLLAWYDVRTTGGSRGIYSHRIDAEAAASPGWSFSGTAICTTSTIINYGFDMCRDGAGGAFVAWTDSRNTPPNSTIVYDVFAHHVRGDGTLDPAWPSQGRSLTTGPGYKYPWAMIADDAGGFWRVSENSIETSKITVTHHAADGSERGAWTTPSFASHPAAVSDGTGGIYFTWEDFRDYLQPPPGDAIYAMRLDSNATPHFGWASDGVLVAGSARTDKLPTITATGDGAVVISWLETGGTPDDEFIAQRVEANGTLTPGWPAGGRRFARSSDILDGWPLAVPDGAGGAMFAFRRNTPNLFGSRVTKTGSVPPSFPDTGLSLCSVSGNQFLQSMVSDGLNGAYVIWEDWRNGSNNSDVYAMRFTRDGRVADTTTVSPTPPPTPSGAQVALSQPRPNPTFGTSAFRLTLSAGTHARVEIIDLSGRRVAILLDEAVSAGTIDLVWDGLDDERRLTPPGVYLLRARAGSEDVSRRIVRLE